MKQQRYIVLQSCDPVSTEAGIVAKGNWFPHASSFLPRLEVKFEHDVLSLQIMFEVYISAVVALFSCSLAR